MRYNTRDHGGVGRKNEWIQTYKTKTSNTKTVLPGRTVYVPFLQSASTLQE